MSLLFLEAVLTGGNEGSLSSESDASDNQYDSSKGICMWCLCFEEVGNLRL